MQSKKPKSGNVQTVQTEQIAQLVLAPHPHRNQQLFSDHYLNVILPARTDWQMLGAEAEPVRRDLQDLFARYTPSEKEAQAEDDFIKPVLRRLGHIFEVQPSLATPDGTKTPDYMFYYDEAALVANKGKKLNETLLVDRAFAVGDAKYWDRPLDISLKRAGSDPFTNKNPSYQIAFYIQHCGLDWGILTNGRLWRLYHKNTAHKLDRFYEVNLPELLQNADSDAFLYFYAFFRLQAFTPGDLSVDKLLQASVDYARAVGDSLKDQVYEALRHVAQGFLDSHANTFQLTPETLKTIYDHSLIVLYRLLFILYAEARDLLPVRESRGYGESYSFDSVKKSIQTNLSTRLPLLPQTVTLWPQLATLFAFINKGSAALDVATFNGGLFDSARYPFLEQYSVGDQHLQQAVDKLARVDGQFVDYRDLAERHLGTIYEGLLEFHLEQAEASDSAWTIDLKTAKGERKATGSYYTPDYIVKYMVEETLGPVLRQAVAQAATAQDKIQAVLNIKVLDPAMGSGHFLVEATEYIARFLVEQIDHTETDGEPELAYWRRRVAQTCIYGLDMNPLAVDLAKLSLWLVTIAKNRPLSFLDHHLRCGNSLVGARLADLKPSVKKNGKKAHVAPKPEVVQAVLFDEESLRQAMTTAVDLMWLIENNPAQTIEQVKEQEQIYKDLRQKLANKYSRLANVVSATHFGVTIDPTYWPTLADYATGRDTIAVPQFETWLQAADAVADRHRFFHWELEFPEVFFDRYGQAKGPRAGFDAVVGNPPYVRQEELGPYKAYFAAAYPETYDGVADLYVYFYQQGLRLARTGGRMSYIVTNKWMRAGYGQALRSYFVQEAALERIVDFGHAPIFQDAEVFPCILVLEKPQPQLAQAQPQAHDVQVLNFPRTELQRVIQKQASLGGYIQEHSHSMARERLSGAAWNLETSAVDDLLKKIQRVGVPLAEFAGVKPYRGVLTGLNEAFLIDTLTKERLIREDPRCAEIIKPYLRGQDIKRWAPEWAGLWMIALKSSGDYAWPWSNGTDIVEAEERFQQAFPSLYHYMRPFKEKLRIRQDQGRYWWELRACAYYALFEQPKIMYQEIQHLPAYCFDNSMLLSNNKAFFLVKVDMYLLGVLNSPLMWWHNWRYLPHMINETLSPVGELMEALPIAPPTDAIRAEVERVTTRLVEITRARREIQQLLQDWLLTEFEVREPGKRLENIGALELERQAFVDEVRKRRPKGAGRLTPAMLRDLQAGYAEQMLPLQQYQAETAALEDKLSDLINAAYGLTAEEIALLWATAPPRMPLVL